ncbi:MULTISPECIES: FKBP-type peptidyl-prolyl cis-trans isomerase [unclassified Mucilaginibacter]|uniref:FKBP-type peptidyl-prolyl cis-trans isomerase n=1 Tax=unclassified Mucilaginibacter TaxID=2617802 RepID=UPI002AC99D29|nr:MULTISPECIES: FKBP-type peptidyl-prolyl cis-trans isomerase [unclassified Mucilaginibacter]MEB0263793.1 FKBP-type peptidyl-prolyl cis-trans isomerase [Mucilaginibacter sp. 10I4]MEB0278251.1 FKBP-type peptidyl-prolyl cis-trans isomerase [Mucilaginibacter sp. 10B2]MEB0300963.1 FKBP-type peptidyl-prolyl cis-trans isomerase [Mucilaginibacter sp. 5C4]WPX23897.1 FKBP-type peptidyl-prolyl cis-trans isomerase [Mucilaginibacter sp. 5C4]
MKLLSYLCLALVLIATSCKRDFKTDGSGVVYIKFTNEDGPRIKQGDFLSMNVLAKTDLDSVIENSEDYGVPRLLILPAQAFKGDNFDALKLLTEGDSIAVKQPVDSIFKTTPKPANFKGKYIVYNIKVLKVIPRQKMDDAQLMEKATAYLKSLNAGLKIAEPKRIEKFIRQKNLVTTKTNSGLCYHVITKGNGPLLQTGDTAVINYTGKLLSDKAFDTNIYKDAITANLFDAKHKYRPVAIPLGQKKLITGLEQGLLLLNKGAKAIFVIPSALAYGDTGFNIVAAYTPIVYTIEVKDVIHPK